MFGQVQDVGVAAFAGHRVALSQGHGRSRARSGGCECAADEITAAIFSFGKYFFDAAAVQEILRCFLHPA